MPLQLVKTNADISNANLTRCANCKIRSHSFCRKLSPENEKEFSCISTELKFKDKQNIFLQEEAATKLYNITSGNVKIYKLLSDGRIQIIGFLYPGDFFGSFKNECYTYSSDAIGEVTTCAFKMKDLQKFIEHDLMLANGLLHQTSHELNLAQDRISILGKFHALERLAAFILNISDQRARIGWQDNPISLPMTRQDIADYLGLTIETVSRCITHLKTYNIIKLINNKTIYIADREKLELY